MLWRSYQNSPKVNCSDVMFNGGVHIKEDSVTFPAPKLDMMGDAVAGKGVIVLARYPSDSCSSVARLRSKTLLSVRISQVKTNGCPRTI